MKRKIVLFLMVATILGTLFVGCGDGNNNTEPVTTNATQATSIETHFDIDEETEPTLPDVDTLTYPQYNALTAEQQQAVVDSFETGEDFIAWYNEAKKEHENFENFVNPDKTDTTTGPIQDGNTEDPNAEDNNKPAGDKVTFLDYQAMSASEQKRFISSFASIDVFMQWHANAVQEYKDDMLEFGSPVTATNPTEFVEAGS